MSQVARYGQMVAHEGRGRELAARMLAAAEVWITELWRSQADLDAAIDRIRGSEEVAAVLSLVAEHEMVELEALGGKGPAAD
jgi:hypothetical protein